MRDVRDYICIYKSQVINSYSTNSMVLKHLSYPVGMPPSKTPFLGSRQSDRRILIGASYLEIYPNSARKVPESYRNSKETTGITTFAPLIGCSLFSFPILTQMRLQKFKDRLHYRVLYIPARLTLQVELMSGVIIRQWLRNDSGTGVKKGKEGTFKCTCGKRFKLP